jgi:4-diphosphocytidyl-2-C-methyl-D-erythritol kinase
MQIDSPAKINLHLRVAPLAADGFHPLLTWMVTLDLHDTITALPSSAGIRLTCDRPDLPCDSTNLIVRAGQAFQKAVSGDTAAYADSDTSPETFTPCTADIRLAKRIAMGGGLGGGSSNAAFTLMLLNRLWNIHWPMPKLAELSASLGADVPFFFHGSSSLCRGRGQFVQPIAPPLPQAALLMLPDFPMPTAAVYRRFDELSLGDVNAVEGDLPDWHSLAAVDLLDRLVNDLEQPAFALEPRLPRLAEFYSRALQRPVRMSGSGSTLFTLYDTVAEAHRAAQAIAPLSTDVPGVRVLVSRLAPQSAQR